MTVHATAEQRAKCVRLYSQGALQKQLAVVFGRPEPTIRQWIRKAGAQRGHKFRGHHLRVMQMVGPAGLEPATRPL